VKYGTKKNYTSGCGSSVCNSIGSKKSALFSMRRAKQLRDGADKLKKDFKNNEKKKPRWGH